MVTTSDGQGINWKWLAGIAGTIILILLPMVGWLISKIVTDKDAALCELNKNVQQVVNNQANIQSSLTKFETNQVWVMNEMSRIRSELSHHTEAGKK